MSKDFTKKEKKSFKTAYEKVVDRIKSERKNFDAELLNALGQASRQQLHNYKNGYIFINEDQMHAVEQVFSKYGMYPWES